MAPDFWRLLEDLHFSVVREGRLPSSGYQTVVSDGSLDLRIFEGGTEVLLDVASHGSERWMDLFVVLVYLDVIADRAELPAPGAWLSELGQALRDNSNVVAQVLQDPIESERLNQFANQRLEAVIRRLQTPP